MTDTLLALAQLRADCRAPEQNLAAMERLAREAAQAGAQLLCFPELSCTGYALEDAANAAQEIPGPTSERLSALACELGLTLLAGLTEREGDARFITQLLCRPGGSIARYRKAHPGRREQALFAPGDALPVFETPTATVGIELCADTHYPEVTTVLSLKGAEVILAPFASPARAGDRRALWLKYLPARAYDARVYLGCCNLLGDNGLGTAFSGGAMLFGPDGETLAEDCSGREGLLLFPLSGEALAPYRGGEGRRMSQTYFPALGRRELYHL